MPELDKLLSLYNYKFPPELIAQAPASPRDSARLLVYSKKNGQVKYDTFANLGKYMPKNSVLVFNQTKVLPARIWVKKETGGKAQILYIDKSADQIKVIADRKLPVNSKLFINEKIFFTIQAQKDNFYFLKPNFPVAKITNVMNKYGQTPLPPYIKHSKLTEKQKREQYQTVFAKAGLSVAAPTASLHFTKKLMASLKKQGIAIKFVTLNVNLGTFAPLTEENIKTGKLHSESYEIDKKTAADLNQAKQAGKNIIAVGTTVIRTLESASVNHVIKKLANDTKLFIQPGYKFNFIDSAITNFHVPKSSLMMLIASLVGRKRLLDIYKKAISKKFRLFSFGDGMLILP